MTYEITVTGNNQYQEIFRAMVVSYNNLRKDLFPLQAISLSIWIRILRSYLKTWTVRISQTKAITVRIHQQ